MRRVASLAMAAAVVSGAASCALDKSEGTIGCHDSNDKLARRMAQDAAVAAVAKIFTPGDTRKISCETDAQDSTALLEFRVPTNVPIARAEDRIVRVLARHGWDVATSDCLEKVFDGHVVIAVVYEPLGKSRGPATVFLSMTGYIKTDSRCDDVEK